MIDTYIHPTAVIDNGAIIGNGCHIWHFVHIMEGAVLGNSCNIGQNVMIAGSAIIGNNIMYRCMMVSFVKTMYS